MSDERAMHEPWPMRSAILLAAGIACGILFHLLIRGDSEFAGSWTRDPLRIAAATFVAVAGILLAFTLERLRWLWSLGFALAGGLVVGGIFYWNGDLETRAADDAMRFVASLVAVAIAAPLFQTIRDEGRLHLPYPQVHAHSWTNVVLWFAAWAFVLAVYLMLRLLAALFDLIGIDEVKDVVQARWFGWAMVGGALGAAAGLLRDRDHILGLLQRVVTTVLSVLAPLLAAGLVLFVAALPFTGLEPLWDQTSATTPILLSCVIGAIILTNAVIGNGPEEEASARVLRWSAIALAAVMLPLVAVAAISTWLRIDQYGFTPDRLWGLVTVAVAAAYALVYLAALVLGRRSWAGQVRAGNIRLAGGVCLLALLLATPLAGFGAISTRDQLARLRSGEVAPGTFDWAAMRFDFGRAGVRALERLRSEGASAEVRRLAAEALAAPNRWELAGGDAALRARPEQQRIRILPEGAAIPAELQGALSRRGGCPETASCVLLLGSAEAILLRSNSCILMEAVEPVRPVRIEPDCGPEVRRFVREEGGWSEAEAPARRGTSEADDLVHRLREGRIELRTVTRRQIFLDGEPIGRPIE